MSFHIDGKSEFDDNFKALSIEEKPEKPVRIKKVTITVCTANPA